MWISGSLAYAATSPVDNTERPFGNTVFGLTLEQALPCRLAVVTGYKIRSYNACIPDSRIETRTAWEYYGIGYWHSYMQVPLQLRWQLPISKWDVKNTIQPGINMIYIAPHAGIDFNIGVSEEFFGETEIPEESINMHKRPGDFFVNGEIGLALGIEMMGLFRIEPFIAYAFHGGRAIDFSLKSPYAPSRTYSRYDTFQAGLRISICLVDWKRTAADRAAAKARTAAYKQSRKHKR